MIIKADQVLIMVNPVDMRLGVDGLSSLVQQALGHSACDGRVYVFRNRVGNRIKLLLWDANGIWLCQRRLHQGRFHWAKEGDRELSLTRAQFNALIMGLEWQRVDAAIPHYWSA